MLLMPFVALFESEVSGLMFTVTAALLGPQWSIPLLRLVTHEAMGTACTREEWRRTCQKLRMCTEFSDGDDLHHAGVVRHQKWQVGREHGARVQPVFEGEVALVLCRRGYDGSTLHQVFRWLSLFFTRMISTLRIGPSARMHF